LTVVPNGDVERIELYVDGADEATPRKTMLKGGGGALLRERIAASMSAFRVNLIDHGKLHDELGSYPLAVEISSEGTAIVTANIDKTLRDMGFVIEHSQVRRTPDGTRFLTDNGYPIYDVKIGTIKDPTALGSALKRILGVLDHGIFVGLSDVLCVVKEDGDVFEIR
jgi:ribose 5-phosphate isomerase A